MPFLINGAFCKNMELHKNGNQSFLAFLNKMKYNFLPYACDQSTLTIVSMATNNLAIITFTFYTESYNSVALGDFLRRLQG